MVHDHHRKHRPDLQLAAFGNDHIQVGHVLATVARLGVLHLLDHVHAVHHLAEHAVLAVQEGGRHRGDEELRAVGVGASILFAWLRLVPVWV